MPNSDETMTRYLFGELSESEQAQLEERYFIDAQTAENEREREARQQLDNEQARTQELTAELERARSEPELQPTPTTTERPAPAVAAPSVASLVLMAGGIRGVDTGAAPTLVIHKGTRLVQLQLK